MKKKSQSFNITKKLLKTKWLVILIATVFLVVVGRTINDISLTKSATVIGVGIDCVENQFKVTLQSVIVSGAASEGTGPVKYVIYTESGNTITQAADKIEQKMGLTVSLAHCNLVILSKTALEINHIALIRPLVQALALPEQAVIVSSAEPPDKLMALKIPIAINVPFYLQTALLQNTGSDGIVRMSVKDFMAKSESRSGAVIVTYVEKQELENQPIDPSGANADFVKLKTDRAVVANETSNVVMDERLAKIAALYSSQDIFGSLNVTMGGGESIEFRILDKKQKQKANGRNVSVEMSLEVEFSEAQGAIERPIFGDDPLILRAAAELEKQLTKDLNDCYLLSKDENIDFLGLQNYVYQEIGRTLEKDCLKTISFAPKVEIKVKESA